MKTAVNMCNWGIYIAQTQDRKVELTDMLEDAKAAGCDGVEVGGLHKRFASVAEAQDTIAGYGLEIAAYGASVTYNPWQPSIDEFQAAVCFAEQLGVNTMMVCGGFLCNQRRNTYDFDYDMFATSIGPAVEFAKDHGAEIAFHPHRGCVCETIAETRKILDRVPDLKICVDTAHLAASGENAIDFIREFSEQITYTHIKDYDWETDRFMELGRGDGKLDLAACMKALQDINYDGWLTIELDREWNDSLPSPLESTKISLEFLKNNA